MVPLIQTRGGMEGRGQGLSPCAQWDGVVTLSAAKGTVNGERAIFLRSGV
jgi:hypothetical protein